ncbi:hypothetical protein FGG08_005977 [Glutinoglossum americanum]|uniref:Uncharacterized protein n=1 Tax=Glutinoglossum americanum TaxID=1670608 RepID=A0A9P8I1W4_9PEZI|nr:hypothetical protein FGG08_005977 [Glutinoglossum americanum]
MSDADTPLPPYTRDPETISVRSAAPSYVSNAPSYRSQLPVERRGQPQNHNRSGVNGNQPIAASEFPNTNIAAWSSIHGHQSRAYLNVASRRADIPNHWISNCTGQLMNIPCSGATTSIISSDAAVGAEARRDRDAEALREESKAWEFMLGQMKDWEERERDWRKFREGVEGRRKKGFGGRFLAGLGRGAGWGG